MHVTIHLMHSLQIFPIETSFLYYENELSITFLTCTRQMQVYFFTEQKMFLAKNPTITFVSPVNESILYQQMPFIYLIHDYIMPNNSEALQVIYFLPRTIVYRQWCSCIIDPRIAISPYLKGNLSLFITLLSVVIDLVHSLTRILFFSNHIKHFFCVVCL